MTTAEQHTEPLRGIGRGHCGLGLRGGRGIPPPILLYTKDPGWQFRVNTATWAG